MNANERRGKGKWKITCKRIEVVFDKLSASICGYFYCFCLRVNSCPFAVDFLDLFAAQAPFSTPALLHPVETDERELVPTECVSDVHAA
jgi:hypothetical protein